MLDKALSLLKESYTQGECRLYVSPSCVSKMIGNKRCNIERLKESGYIVKIIQSDKVPFMEVALKG